MTCPAMSTSQQLPLENQMSANDEKDEVAHLRTGPPRVHITRSNSAPQAQGKFISHKHGGTQKVNPSSRQSPSKKQLVLEGDQNIHTLSDGVIHVDHHKAIQAAACVLASHDHLKEHSPGGSYSTSMSSTPLCDTNHLPSTTECCFENSPVHSQDENSVDVWQFREKSQEFGQLRADISTSNQSTSGVPHLEQRDIIVTRTDQYRHQLNKARKGSVPCTSQTFYAGQDVSNGAFMRETGLESKSAVPANELQGFHSSSREIVQEGDNAGIRRPFQKWDHHSHQWQVQSETIYSSEMQRILSLASVKEKGYARLEEELLRAQKALEMKDEEVDELKGIRSRLMKEVSDFTAALFEEVNSQLNEAAISEQHARKQLMEAKSKIEVLSAEVAALKDLVLTSTPSSPNKHLHPQIDTSSKKDKGGKPFWKTHRRSTSHHQFTKESREKAEANEHHSQLKELDTVAFDEFQRWRLQPTVEFTGQFFARAQMEDIQPCLNFRNKILADKVIESVRSNSLSIEPIPGDQSYPRKCCLSESHKLCNYKIKFEGDDKWYSISQMSRNRIAAVCDFYAYLRYIVQGLVKCPDKDMFAELVRLRNQMAQTRLGLI